MLCAPAGVKFKLEKQYLNHHIQMKLYPNSVSAAKGWLVIVFKNNWNLSTVKCSISRKATQVYTDDQLDDFLMECRKQRKIVGSNNFFNMDEMKCRVATYNINVS